MCKNVSVTIIPIPCLRDNYAYLVHRPDSRKCLVIDPSEAEPVRKEVARRGLQLVAIACTHHHWDHVGGNRELGGDGVRIYGHHADLRRIPGLTDELKHGQTVEIAGVEFRILHVPGHTMGAITYVGDGVAFTGDTLFCGGCGRLFEGSPERMYHSLNVTLGALPEETEVFVGHEYTEANLEFAASLEPKNQDLRERLQLVRQRRREGLFCASAPLAVERRTNPFLRCDSKEIRATLRQWTDDPTSVFAAIRARKDAA